ncbi:MAG: hypothetical protein J5680_00915, partial [Neisseriaceae bacterium]|nr:hypothetical protein [Neisseriaceae bacterium]
KVFNPKKMGDEKIFVWAGFVKPALIEYSISKHWGTKKKMPCGVGVWRGVFRLSEIVFALPFFVVRRLLRRCYATARNDSSFFVWRCCFDFLGWLKTF